ncbi:MAG: DHH family phosphoesterase [Acidilobus sp.]
MSLSRNSLASLIASSEPLIIHHWDADGVASAVTAASFAQGRADFVVPPLTYTPSVDFVRHVVTRSSDKDLILVLDYNASSEFLAALASASGKPVVVVDHHLASYPRIANLYYYNPAAEGDPEGLWPSAAHLLADAIGFYDPLLIAMSIYGDLQDSSQMNRVFRYYMEQIGLDPVADAGIPRGCAMQVWGAEAASDLELLAGLPVELTYGAVDPCQALLSDPRLSNHRMRAEEEVERAVKEALATEARRGRAVVYTVSLRMRVTGMVTRRLLAASGLPVVIVLAREGQGKSKIYVRGEIGDPTKLVAILRGSGLRASGKRQPYNDIVVVDVGHVRDESAVERVVEAVNLIA